ncbi:hypothetical protein DID73_00600 [Candidatus Marinamargulisbacteria bacterium SCGC AG-343-K17]|nr:hypothetical protein DID73_00600 [Candidatus Marinamargulisbacteria bacterium SCGC AG-343-K17]
MGAVSRPPIFPFQLPQIQLPQIQLPEPDLINRIVDESTTIVNQLLDEINHSANNIIQSQIQLPEPDLGKQIVNEPTTVAKKLLGEINDPANNMPQVLLTTIEMPQASQLPTIELTVRTNQPNGCCCLPRCMTLWTR